MKAKTSTETTAPAPKNVSEERDLDVEKKLTSLYALQHIDSEIDAIRTLRGELPLEVQDLEDDIAGYESHIEKLQDEIEEINQNIAERKHAVTDIKAQIKKYDKQLKEVKNSREYDNLNKEIEYQTLENQLHEKRIKEANILLEKKTEDLEKLRHAREERQKDLELKQSELNEIVAETEKDEKELMKRSELYQKRIEPRWLHVYSRIRNNAHNGLAVVCVDRDACGGCFSKIPPQRQIDIRTHKKMISCEYCGRFLVDEDIKEKAEDLLQKDKK